jgi:RimJ/RimL family protein N-acetyltransferase
MELREATPDDRELILGWRNLPEIVALSSSRTTVSPADHARWFADALGNPARLLFVVEVDGEPVGHIRVEDDPAGESTVSIYLVPARTGRGIGVPALREACRRAFQRGRTELRAVVRSDNDRSIAAFTRVGFRPTAVIADCVPAGHVCLVLTSLGDWGR